MGYPMASNVRRKVSTDTIFRIYDVDKTACERFQSEHRKHGSVEIVDTPRAAAEGGQAIISILPSADVVREVYLDKDTGIIAAREDPNRILLECSTIDSESARSVGVAIASGGAGAYIDTPVSVYSPYHPH